MTKNYKNPEFEDTIQCYYFTEKKLTNLQWKELCHDLNQSIALKSLDYIWHRDEFKITLPISNAKEEKDCPDHLISITCFGDNIDDEWYIVHLLFELTKEYNDIIVKIEDNDGDFLLIEAANNLPPWANPDNTENRVFIYKENVHIIPPSVISHSLDLNISKAISVVIEKTIETKASLNIQEAILKRVNNVKQIHKNIHRAVIHLPLEIATVLYIKPSLISALVSSFCNADALEIKHYKDIQFDNCVNAEIVFTKHLYAMLLHAKFPNMLKLKQYEKDKRQQLGFKLTCGYKILLNTLSTDIFLSPEYQKYLNTLIKNGFFKENIEGSKEYNELLQKAKHYFTQIECPHITYISKEINDIKSFKEFEKVKNNIKLKSNMDCLTNDSDEWLHVDPNQLDDFLNTQYDNTVKAINNETVSPNIITTKLGNFLKKSSDFEGIEQIRYEVHDDSNIEFDSDEFVHCLDKMLKIVSSDLNDSEISEDNSVSEDELYENQMGLEQDVELASKLKSTNNINGDRNNDVVQNFKTSMKEEGLSGPSSTVLKTIGIRKSDLLDSDDDDSPVL